ncbi:hypothetical protein QFZ55_000138 [Streptomyces luteogriseus]|nr:hypothetical protein [Streptomyces luteogriseus]
MREGLVQLLAQGGDVGERGSGGQDGRDGELVSAEPCGYGLPLLGPGGEAAAGCGDDGVAGGVAVGVVDGLEAVAVGSAQVRGILDLDGSEPARGPHTGARSARGYAVFPRTMGRLIRLLLGWRVG